MTTRSDGAIRADNRDGDEPDDDLLDPDDEVDEPDDAPTGSPPRQKAEEGPTYRELLAENERLKRGVKRNNRELAQRRKVADWMETHGIEDLDAWLSERGIDKETGGKAEPAPAPSAPPAEPAPVSAAPDESDFDRRVALEVERLRAQDEAKADEADERAEKRGAKLKKAALEAALLRANFNGAIDRAMRVTDLDGLEVDEDGEVQGVDDAVESLRKDIPEWFRSPRERTRTGGEDVDGGRRRTAPPPKRTWEEQALGRMGVGQPGRR